MQFTGHRPLVWLCGWDLLALIQGDALRDKSDFGDHGGGGDADGINRAENICDEGEVVAYKNVDKSSSYTDLNLNEIKIET